MVMGFSVAYHASDIASFASCSFDSESAGFDRHCRFARVGFRHDYGRSGLRAPYEPQRSVEGPGMFEVWHRALCSVGGLNLPAH